MDAAVYAAKFGRVDKAAAIVESLIESSIRKKATIWLHTYTVANADPADSQKFKHSKKAKNRWDEDIARNNPFWNIKLRSKVPSAIFTPDASVVSEDAIECIIAKRQIKIAFKRFISNPTLDAKSNLISMLSQYQACCGHTDGNETARFIAGGLPSLGKRR